jgi:hypothetical protein
VLRRYRHRAKASPPLMGSVFQAPGLRGKKEEVGLKVKHQKRSKMPDKTKQYSRGKKLVDTGMKAYMGGKLAQRKAGKPTVKSKVMQSAGKKMIDAGGRKIQKSKK